MMDNTTISKFQYINMDSGIEELNILNTEFDLLKIANTIANYKFQENSFYVCDVNNIIDKYNMWRSLLPRVEPHYAVKCNNHPIVLKVLAALGIGFDCASRTEIKQVLSIGVNPKRIIYAHPTKVLSHLQYAASVNVDLLTFDNEMELYKIQEIHPNARAVIRIKFDCDDSYCVLGLKFGCNPKTEAKHLLQIARNININVVGVSFHVGSGCKDPSAFYSAIQASRYVFDVASELNFDFKLLDIGGGFLGEDKNELYNYAEFINSGLNTFFPDKSVRIISEPGTYFVDSAFILASNIHSLKSFEVEYSENHGMTTKYMYYLNDGVFGSFSDIISYKDIRIPIPLKKLEAEEEEEELFLSTVWGPTCDSIDKIGDVLLPKMKIGDWLVFKKIGAYSFVLATSFNGFDTPEVYSFINLENWLMLQEKCINIKGKTLNENGSEFLILQEN